MGDVTAGQYAAGVIGLALLRRWYADGEVNEARMAELADVLGRSDEFPASLVLNPVERDIERGYAEWAGSYDGGRNPLIDVEQPAVWAILERLGGRGVRALDAACGTGRHAAFLVELGCDAVGVDQSDAMLDVARAKVHGARFELGDLRTLPFGAGEFDVVVASLALCHLVDLPAGVDELARVLRPGGTLVVADPHPVSEIVGGQAFYGGITPGEPMTFVRNHYRSAAAWLSAFRSAGLTVAHCREMCFGEDQITAMPAYPFHPDAVRAAIEGLPCLWVWEVTCGSI